MDKALKDHLKDFYLNKSEVFCILPWVHIHTWPDGRVLPCCYAQPESPLGHLDQGLKGVWNNEAYKSFRQKMLNNIPAPEYCERCYEFDKSGNFSFRKHSNKKFGKHLDEALDKTDVDGTYHDFKLRYIDFRYSNLCNLTCRSCCHTLSSKWYKESVRLYGDSGASPIIAPKNQGYLDEAFEILPFVEAAYFAGGEPLLQDEHYLILDKLRALGKLDVDLSYNTNFSTLGTKGRDLFEYWRGFKSLRIGASLDGSWRRGELLRKGLDWNRIVENRKRLLETPPEVGHFEFGVSATVGATNALHIPDFHKEWVEAGFIDLESFHINPICDPDFLRVNILPREYKEEVESKYRKFMKEYLSSCPAQYEQYESFLRFMWEQDLSELLPTYFWWSRTLDGYRGESLVDVFPEWEQLFADYNR